MCLYADRLEETGWVVSEQGCSGISSTGQQGGSWPLWSRASRECQLSPRVLEAVAFLFFFFIGMYLIPNVVISLGG